MDNKLLMILFASAHTKVRTSVLCWVCVFAHLLNLATHAYIAHAQANLSLCV